MAVTENSYTGNGSTTNYSFTFPYLKSTDVQVQVDATVTTAWTFANATTVQFNTAPANNSKIKILRDTNVDALTATFYAGSAIKSEDLNDNYTQNLYKTQEVGNRYFATTGGTMTGDLSFGEDVKLTFEGATDNANETILTVADPTADRTITLPDTTGTVVTTGDTGTINATMLAANSVDSSELVDGSVDLSHMSANSVDSTQYVDGSIDHVHLANDVIDGDNIQDDVINSEHIAAGAVDLEHMSANSVDSNQYVDGSIDLVHMSANSVDSNQYVDGSIDLVHMSANSVDSDQYVDGSIDLIHMSANSVDSDQYVDGSIDTAHIAADQITSALIADDQIDSEHYVADSIDTEHYAPNSVDTTALAADAVTGAQLADNAVDSEHYTDGSIDRVHLAADIVDGTKIADNAIDSEHYVDGSIDRVHLAADIVDGTKIADNAIGAEHIAANAVTTSEIADAELTTLAGMPSGTASILASSTALTATTAEINSVVDGKAPQTTISDDDTKYPTSGAVVDYVAAQLAPIGGLEVIADEDNFPAIPASGVVISIADVDGIVINSSGVCTTARTAGNGSDNVTINGFPTALRSKTLSGSLGLMVSSTGSSNTYTYHKLLGKEDDIEQLSQDISDFGNRYRVNAGEPSSNNDDGDLVFDTNANKMKVYDATASAWKEVTSSGDFKFLVPVDAGTTTAATWDGNDTSFDLKETTNSGSAASITSVYQLIVSLNGVIQKPNTGSWSSSGEGFYLTDSDTIRFATAPPNGSSAFIIQVGSAITPTTPADNTVSTVKIQNGAINNDKLADNSINGNKLQDDCVATSEIQDNAVNGAKIAADAIDGTKIADDAVGSEHIEVLDAALQFGDNVKAQFGTGNDAEIYFDSSNLYIKETTGAGDIYVESDDIYLRKNGGTETMAHFKSDADVSLFYNNAKKCETTNSGLRVYGNLDLEDDEKIRLGDGDDFQLYHDGTSSYISNTTGNLYIEAKAGETAIQIVPDGATDLRYNGSKKLETTSNGITVTGAQNKFQTSGEVSLMIGSTDAGGAAIYFDGDSNGDWIGSDYSHIRHTTGGDMEICADNPSNDGHIYLKVADGTEKAIVANANSSVELYHDNSKKFETTATGGHITSGANATSKLHIGHQATRGLDIRIANTGGQVDSTCILDAKDSESSNYHAQIQFHLGASEKARFEGNGNYFRMASGTGGIQFGGDSAAANALDDYEEGTYQPTVTGHTSGSWNTSSYVYLSYTKIGRLVHIGGYLNINSESSPNGDVYISLPFAVANLDQNAEYGAITCSLRSHGGSNFYNMVATITSNNSIQLLAVDGSGTATWLNDSHIGSAWNVRLGGCYVSSA